MWLASRGIREMIWAVLYVQWLVQKIKCSEMWRQYAVCSGYGRNAVIDCTSALLMCGGLYVPSHLLFDVRWDVRTVTSVVWCTVGCTYRHLSCLMYGVLYVPSPLFLMCGGLYVPSPLLFDVRWAVCTITSIWCTVGCMYRHLCLMYGGLYAPSPLFDVRWTVCTVTSIAS